MSWEWRFWQGGASVAGGRGEGGGWGEEEEEEDWEPGQREADWLEGRIRRGRGAQGSSKKGANTVLTQ